MKEIVAWCMACGQAIEDERWVKRKVLKRVLDKVYEAAVCRHHPDQIFDTLQAAADEWAKGFIHDS